MEIKQLIKRNNLDGLGKYFLKNGFEFFIINEIDKAYEFIKLGLNTLTCDCVTGDWKPDTINLNISLPTSSNVNMFEFHFCKAVILSYNEDTKSLYVALDAIDIFLTESETALGLYIKAKILTALEKYSEAKDCYEISYNYDPCSRTMYRLGRLNEQYLEIFGLDYLYKAYKDNPTSACCCRVLKEYNMKREIKLELQSANEGNPLIIKFIGSNDPWELQRYFQYLLEEEQIDYLNNSLKSNIVIDNFIKFINFNKIFFIQQEGEYDDYDSPDYDYEADYDEMYFDAMTDGQLGSYDEFRERGGDLDLVDDWSGR